MLPSLRKSKHSLELAVEKFALEKNPKLFDDKFMSGARDCVREVLDKMDCHDDLAGAIVLSAIYHVREDLPESLCLVRTYNVTTVEMLSENFDEVSYYAWLALVMCLERRGKKTLNEKIESIRDATPRDKLLVFEELLREYQVEAKIEML